MYEVGDNHTKDGRKGEHTSTNVTKTLPQITDETTLIKGEERVPKLR